LPPFTFVGATTDEWALAKPLRDRFKIVLRLEHYAEPELVELVGQRARRLGWPATDEAVRGIGGRGRGPARLPHRRHGSRPPWGGCSRRPGRGTWRPWGRA